MFCIQCGVRLADTEKKCPLCGTIVYHPECKQADARPLYPKNQTPKIQANPATFNGIMIILYLIPILICLMSDLKRDAVLNWFGFALGGILLCYIITSLPFWFQKPNPVIFVSCDFLAVMVYLFYINYASGGNWFWSFALPAIGVFALIISALITLLYYVKKGRLFIIGGFLIVLGAFMVLLEFLIMQTFHIPFSGWSLYPLVTLALLGGMFLYLAINKSAREVAKRKLFF